MYGAPSYIDLCISPHLLLACLNLIHDGIISSLPDPGFEVEINQLPTQNQPHSSPTLPTQKTYLSLLRLPLSIRVPVEYQLITASIANLNRSMRERALGLPFDLIADIGPDEEGVAAALVAVCVDALLYCEVEDFAFGDGVTGYIQHHNNQLVPNGLTTPTSVGRAKVGSVTYAW